MRLHSLVSGGARAGPPGRRRRRTTVTSLRSARTRRGEERPQDGALRLQAVDGGGVGIGEEARQLLHRGLQLSRVGGGTRGRRAFARSRRPERAARRPSGRASSSPSLTRRASTCGASPAARIAFSSSPAAACTARADVAGHALDGVGQALGHRRARPARRLSRDPLRRVRLPLHELPQKVVVELGVARHAPQAVGGVEAVDRRRGPAAVPARASAGLATAGWARPAAPWT